MSRFAPRSHGEQSRDVGFTLIEVIWALVLLGIIAMASLGLFTNGLKSVAHVQRQQAAVSVANSAMDTARSVAGGAVNADKTSGLVRGRSEEAVNAAWGAADPSDVSDMEKVWDHESGLHDSDQWVPITSTARVDSQTYTITTLVGACYRLKAASTSSQDCIPGKDGDTSYSLMYRVRVVVTWDEGTKTYSYRLSTLVDPTDDPTWNTELDPYAYDDDATVDAGTSKFIAIVANDTVDYNADGSESPIVIKTADKPSYGTATPGGKGSLGGVDFAAPSAKSGTVTFKYYVRGGNGKQSKDPGTVTVHILPVPVSDTIYVNTGSTTVLTDDMLANDIGVDNLSSSRKTTIVPVADPSVDMFTTEEVTDEIKAARQKDAEDLAALHVSMSGGDVVFHAPTTKEDTVFYYYLVDDGTSSDAARYPSTTAVKVTVSTQDPPLLTPDKTLPSYDVTSDTDYVDDAIDWKSLTGNQYAKDIRITGVTGSVADGSFDDNILIDGHPFTSAPNQQGQSLTFSRNSDSTGTYVITYKVVSSSGIVSDTTGTITVTVLPRVADKTLNSVSSGSSVDLSTIDIAPTLGVKAVSVTVVGGGCSASPTGLKVEVTYNPWWTSSCKFTYKLQSTGLDPNVTSSGTGTVTVNK